eukprot:5464387-Pleurochrysis_carterae.AAC.1
MRMRVRRTPCLSLPPSAPSAPSARQSPTAQIPRRSLRQQHAPPVFRKGHVGAVAAERACSLAHTCCCRHKLRSTHLPGRKKCTEVAV